jgi:hypothetical protein
MTRGAYGVADVSFAVAHAALCLFLLAGWAFRRTRRAHLVATIAVFLSWFGLGLVYGIGYCPCTDWHWQVKRRLGERNLPISYVEYYADRYTGIDWDPRVVDGIVVGSTAVAFGLSVWLNVRDRRRRRAEAIHPERVEEEP